MIEKLINNNIVLDFTDKAMSMFACPICYREVPFAETVMCRNGHRCCIKDHLQYLQAVGERNIYRGGQIFHGDNNAQCCFECRVDIPDYRFNDEEYFKSMLKIIVNSKCRAYGFELSAELNNEFFSKKEKETKKRIKREANSQRTLRKFYDRNIRCRGVVEVRVPNVDTGVLKIHELKVELKKRNIPFRSRDRKHVLRAKLDAALC